MRGGTRRRAARGGQSRAKRRARRSSVAAGPSATAGRSPNFSGALRDSPARRGRPRHLWLGRRGRPSPNQ